MHLSIVGVVSVLCLVGCACGDQHVTSATDLDLIKLYLEEFRLELLSVKSQLVRMARNSKLVRTNLKELRSSKCDHNKHAALGSLRSLLSHCTKNITKMNFVPS